MTIPFPCRHFSPASITGHFDESIMKGRRTISGSAAMRLTNFVIISSESSIPSSRLMSSAWAPPSTWLRATSRAFSRSPARMSFANRREPATFVRSPMFMKFDSGVRIAGSRPLSWRWFVLSGGFLGVTLSTASATRRICSGVVPQQPPTTLRKPLRAKSPIRRRNSAGVSSYSPNSLGRPALGWALTGTGATFDNSSINGRICFAPRAQLRPTLSRFGVWATDIQKA